MQKNSCLGLVNFKKVDYGFSFGLRRSSFSDGNGFSGCLAGVRGSFPFRVVLVVFFVVVAGGSSNSILDRRRRSV